MSSDIIEDIERLEELLRAGVGGGLMGVMGKVGHGGKRCRSLRLMAATMD
jgi:hypothetical protein